MVLLAQKLPAPLNSRYPRACQATYPTSDLLNIITLMLLRKERFDVINFTLKLRRKSIRSKDIYLTLFVLRLVVKCLVVNSEATAAERTA